MTQTSPSLSSVLDRLAAIQMVNIWNCAYALEALLIYTEAMEFSFTPHALERLQRRDILLQDVLMVLDQPEQIVAAKGGRSAYQSKVNIDENEYLLRLIVEPG